MWHLLCSCQGPVLVNDMQTTSPQKEPFFSSWKMRNYLKQIQNQVIPSYGSAYGPRLVLYKKTFFFNALKKYVFYDLFLFNISWPCSHCSNFGTWFNILLVFRLPWHDSLQDSLGLFFRKLWNFNKKICFGFQIWKPLWTRNFLAFFLIIWTLVHDSTYF